MEEETEGPSITASSTLGLAAAAAMALDAWIVMRSGVGTYIGLVGDLVRGRAIANLVALELYLLYIYY